MDTIDYTCPRCEADAAETFYGPCTDCRAQLREKYLGEKRTVEAEAYEPKMNVTPNAIATKE